MLIAIGLFNPRYAFYSFLLIYNVMVFFSPQFSFYKQGQLIFFFPFPWWIQSFKHGLPHNIAEFVLGNKRKY